MTKNCIKALLEIKQRYGDLTKDWRTGKVEIEKILNSVYDMGFFCRYLQMQ